MSVNRLVVTIAATHSSLEWRFDEATQHATRTSHPRDVYARTDALHAATSRHLAAADEVLLDVARHRLPDGSERVKEYLHRARLLERAMARLKARLYGEVHAVQLPWDQVWDEVRRELREHNRMEVELVRDLTAAVGPEESGILADRLFRAEVRAPTRSHPYTPHTGMLGRVARRVWAKADRFWDAAEGRVVPQPVRPPSKEHSHDSLIAQYLVGEPLLDEKAPVFAHRRHHR